LIITFWEAGDLPRSLVCAGFLVSFLWLTRLLDSPVAVFDDRGVTYYRLGVLGPFRLRWDEVKYAMIRFRLPLDIGEYHTIGGYSLEVSGPGRRSLSVSLVGLTRSDWRQYERFPYPGARDLVDYLVRKIPRNLWRKPPDARLRRWLEQPQAAWGMLRRGLILCPIAITMEISETAVFPYHRVVTRPPRPFGAALDPRRPRHPGVL
jgi:hypothetical protein